MDADKCRRFLKGNISKTLVCLRKETVCSSNFIGVHRRFQIIHEVCLRHYGFCKSLTIPKKPKSFRKHIAPLMKLET